MPSATWKLQSWNVNGLRSVLKKGFLEFVAQEKPDALCLQETKWDAEGATLDVPGYEAHWSHAQKKGYAGTATLTRRQPLQVSEGIGIAEHDTEGRILTSEFEKFYLVNVYTPNSQRTLERLPYREKWDTDFLAFVKKLEKKKPVIFCGDLNVAHAEIDLANPKGNRGTHGFTDEERAGFDRLLEAGFVDTFRHLEPAPGHYSWWSQRPGVRARNIGWRIDYFLISGTLEKNLRSARILKDITGSDHAPIEVILGGL